MFSTYIKIHKFRTLYKMALVSFPPHNYVCPPCLFSLVVRNEHEVMAGLQRHKFYNIFRENHSTGSKV